MKKVNTLIRLLSVTAAVWVFSATLVLGEKNTAIDASEAIDLLVTHSRVAPPSRVRAQAMSALREGDTVRLLAEYEKSPDKKVRNNTVWTYEAVLSTCSDGVKRRAIVSRLVFLAGDADRYVYNQAFRSLARLDARDFDAVSRKSILLNVKSHPLGELGCLMIGVLGDKTQQSRLRELVAQATDYRKYGAPWYARLALARMGSETDANECVRIWRSEPNVVTKACDLLDGLAWTRTPQAMSAVLEYLESKDRLPSTTPYGNGTMAAFRALDIIVQSVDGCPVEYNGRPGLTTIQDLNVVREWARNNTVFRWSTQSNLQWP